MSIALILSRARAEEWKVEINKYLPEIKVEIFPRLKIMMRSNLRFVGNLKQIITLIFQT
jgi:hypothetical protein